MLIVERFRAIRQTMNVNAEEVERRAGLEHSYLSDVENGQIVPTVAVWERIATALEIPLAKLFYDDESFPLLRNLPGRKTADEIAGVPKSERLKKRRTQPFSKSDNQSS